MLTLKTYYPKWINYTWCPANYKQHQPNNWWQNPEAYDYLMKEITNLVLLLTYFDKSQVNSHS
jgi:hypothetical protein